MYTCGSYLETATVLFRSLELFHHNSAVLSVLLLLLLQSFVHNDEHVRFPSTSLDSEKFVFDNIVSLQIPSTVFTPLEYAFVGMSEDEAIVKRGSDGIEVYHAYFKPLEYTVPQRLSDNCYLKVTALNLCAMIHIPTLMVRNNSVSSRSKWCSLNL